MGKVDHLDDAENQGQPDTDDREQAPNMSPFTRTWKKISMPPRSKDPERREGRSDCAEYVGSVADTRFSDRGTRRINRHQTTILPL